jgi:hypothetical protein
MGSGDVEIEEVSLPSQAVNENRKANKKMGPPARWSRLKCTYLRFLTTWYQGFQL